jgi:lipopolysaccharide/colanic/teichoic acid biosynthesis glycosyltransferase
MYKIIKRLIDLIATIVVTIILSPLLIPVFIALKLTAEGEVFYGQERVGYKQKRFKILKFATMLKNSPNIGTGDITLRNDPRVTPVGKFLRITKLNELPQVFNVLLGDMSLVGPRPLMPVSFEYYPKQVQDVVYNSIPGITGIGSLVFRDEEKLVSEQKEMPHRDFYRHRIYPYKGELELWYQQNKSTYTDLMIIFLTAYSIGFKNNKLVYKIFRTLPPSPFKVD